MYEFYKQLLLKKGIPEFLKKYLECPSFVRLKKIGYFCGMDYASKDIYDFSEYISRYDHSLNVALLTWNFTKDKRATLAGLFHDIATPCFSHVIDYMNNDYEKQESTEEFTESIISNDKLLLEYLNNDNIKVNDIIYFKKYSIVDNDRPKLCADRLDGIILTGLFWTKNIDKKDIVNILNHIKVFKNEDNESELGFDEINIAKKVMNVNESIDIISHSNEDNYMMELLASLTKYIIDNNYIDYEDLYNLNEDDIHSIFAKINDLNFVEKYMMFKTIKKENVPFQSMPYVKKRNLNVIVNNERMK